MKFPAILRKLRESAGLNQEELGKIIGVSASTIGMYEQSRRTPDKDKLIDIARYFGVSTDYLLGLESISEMSMLPPSNESIEQELEKKVTEIFRSIPEIKELFDKISKDEKLREELLKTMNFLEELKKNI